METYSGSSEEQLAVLAELDLEAPVAVLNFFWFNARARYAPEDPEHGTQAGEVTGMEAFAVYGAVAGRVVSELGGRVLFSTSVDQVMIGPRFLHCDRTAIMYFPTRRAYVEMTRNPEFQAASRHRRAALANHHMLHLDGRPLAGLIAG